MSTDIMFRNDIQQYQWLFAGLIAGVVIVAIIVLTYFPFWRARTPPVSEERPSGGPVLPWIVAYMPWILILTFIGTLIFAIGYTARSIVHTPNW